MHNANPRPGASYNNRFLVFYYRGGVKSPYSPDLNQPTTLDLHLPIFKAFEIPITDNMEGFLAKIKERYDEAKSEKADRYNTR